MPASVNSELIGRIRELGDQVASSAGIEIADVQLRGAGKARLLRIYIDKPGGVTHGDCELISGRLGQVLDEQDTMPDEGYMLEVSSLGPDRKFSTPRDYERVIGHKVAIALRSAEQGMARVEGKLLAVHGGSIDLEVRPGKTLEIPFEQVAKAKLKFEP
jgi:ribosome maturation factor RimP